MPLAKAPYIYNATVISNHDGDTITVDLDRGYEDRSRRSVRLLGCNARELSQPGGKEARDHLTVLLPPGTFVIVTSSEWDKYGGRIDALLQAEFGDVTDRMITDGYAAAWNGTGKAPLPPWPLPEEESTS